MEPTKRGSTSSRKSRDQPKVKFESGQGTSHPPPGKTRKWDPVWGKTPNWKGGQSGLTELLAEQKRLNGRLRAQARLARLDPSEVRSTEAERLRAVNQAMLDNVPLVPGIKNPFSKRNLTDAQILSEDMVRRQGVRQLHASNEPCNRPTPPSSRSMRSRRKFSKELHGSSRNPPRDWFSLQGPLARYYRRAVERGYKGSPEAWLRGPKAAALRVKLASANFKLAEPWDWDCFNPRSPLHWALNQCSVQAKLSFPTGFSGERIRTRPTDSVVRGRQAASVQRLRLQDWPRSSDRGLSWPTYPTLNESWMMARRGKFPIHHKVDPVQERLLSGHKVPTRQVKPGAKARTVSNLVIGIRADIEVPRKLLVYFRYRWGFLILRRSIRNVLPDELVRLLVKIWKEDISGMFLRYPIRFREALRRIPTIEYYSMVGFVPARPTKKLDKIPRKRAGRHERSAAKLSKLEGWDFPSPPASLTSESGDGVRLC